MRNNLVVGILRETKEWEYRSPLVPADVHWLTKRGIAVEVESSPQRIFRDEEFRAKGAKVVDRFKQAALLLGIKEPRVEDLYRDKIYMVFSHTAKGQTNNLGLLKSYLKNNVTLIDYEKIVDLHGKRLVYFGRFAGICGLVDSLHYLGKKLAWGGVKNPFLAIEPTYKYDSLRAVKLAMSRVDRQIRTKGFQKKLSPFVIGITGHGNVSRGVQEILESLNPIEIHPQDMLQFIRHQRRSYNKLYKIVFLREEKFRSKDGRGFYFEEYLKNPRRFESNIDLYLPFLNILMHTSYWESRFPRIVTKAMVDNLSRKRPFRLEFIGDISCDVNGSVELTYKTTSPHNPVFTYIPRKKAFVDGYESKGISILAVDNLPAELPKDGSEEFSGLIRDYVYQVAAHGVKDITNHIAIPAEIRRAVITQNKRLTRDFKYLKKYINKK